MEIVAATSNRNKLAELRTVASEHGISILSPADVRERFSLPPPPDVAEDDPTFVGNARLKSQAFLAWSGIASLGDDSGLEVFALDGRPGVRSARYAGPGASDADRMRRVVEELDRALAIDPSKDRTAQFRSVLVLTRPDGRELIAEGTLRGEILQEPRGSGGFGYDPIVHIFELGKTLAEVDFAVTCRDGFRAKAMRSLIDQIRRIPGNG